MKLIQMFGEVTSEKLNLFALQIAPPSIECSLNCPMRQLARIELKLEWMTRFYFQQFIDLELCASKTF